MSRKDNQFYANLMEVASLYEGKTIERFEFSGGEYSTNSMGVVFTDGSKMMVMPSYDGNTVEVIPVTIMCECDSEVALSEGD